VVILEERNVTDLVIKVVIFSISFVKFARLVALGKQLIRTTLMENLIRRGNKQLKKRLCINALVFAVKFARLLVQGLDFLFVLFDLSNFFYSKDTFDAHVKGQKHQRTIALLRRMGKPVPQIDFDNIGANLTTKAQGKPIPTVGTSGPLKKVVGVTGTKFVGGTTLLTTGEEYKMGTNAATAVTGAMKPQDLEVLF